MPCAHHTLYGTARRATLSVREDGRLPLTSTARRPPRADLLWEGEDMTSPADQLAATLRGPVYRPQDEGYEAVRPVYNAMIDRYPQVIAQCADVTEDRKSVV